MPNHQHPGLHPLEVLADMVMDANARSRFAAELKESALRRKDADVTGGPESNPLLLAATADAVHHVERLVRAVASSGLPVKLTQHTERVGDGTCYTSHRVTAIK